MVSHLCSELVGISESKHRICAIMSDKASDFAAISTEINQQFFFQRSYISEETEDIGVNWAV